MNNQNKQVAVRPCNTQTVKALLEKNKQAMLDSLPKHIKVDRLIRIVLTQLTRNQKLQECTQGSLIGGILQCALWGLEPDGVEGALVPFKNKGVMEATFMPMVQGVIKLTHNTENIQMLYGEVVKHNDNFQIKKGLHPDLIHEPLLTGERGAVIGAYAVVNYVNGGADYEYMTLDELHKVRATSKAHANAKKYKKQSLWDSWPEEMYKKTVIKRLSKRIPKSQDLKEVVEHDNRIESGKNLQVAGLFDEVGFEKPADLTPSIEPPQPTKPLSAEDDVPFEKSEPPE